jgi:putative addiction module CopG family antidote
MPRRRWRRPFSSWAAWMPPRRRGPGHLERVVEAVVKSGRYGSASEVVREGLRLVEERETKLKALHKALSASIAEGDDPGRLFGRGRGKVPRPRLLSETINPENSERHEAAHPGIMKHRDLTDRIIAMCCSTFRPSRSTRQHRRLRYTVLWFGERDRPYHSRAQSEQRREKKSLSMIRMLGSTQLAKDPQNQMAKFATF